MRSIKIIIGIMVVALTGCQGLVLKSSSQLKQIVETEVQPLVVDGEQNSYPSISAVIVQSDEHEIIHMGQGHFDNEKLFEVGGITTLYTALLFAQLEKEEVVVKNDFLKDLFPTFGMPASIEDKVQIKHLLAHSSGFPAVPKGFKTKYADPFSKYNFKRLFLSMRKTPLVSNPEERTRFSHMGYSLLGYGLAASMETNYNSALKQKVLDPFGLKSTVIKNPQDKAQQVAAFTESGELYEFWKPRAFAPAVGLKTNLTDMAQFMKMQVKPTEDLKQTVSKSHEVIYEKGSFHYAYGWQHRISGGKKYYWLNGSTYGFTSVIIVQPKTRKAVFLVANKQNKIEKNGKKYSDVRLTKKAFKIIKSL